MIIQTAINSFAGKFFSVTFIKKDGTERKMVCRTGVKYKLKGTKSKTTAKRKETLVKRNMITVFEPKSQQYKTITETSVKELKCGDITITQKVV